MKKWFSALLLLLLALPLHACQAPGSSDTPPGAALPLPETVTPASQAAYCDGFGSLTWGENYDTLLRSGQLVEVVQRTYPFGDYYCSVYYTFDETGGLTSGYCQFNESHTLNGIEVYLQVRNLLLSAYGPAEEGLTLTADGQSVPAPTIEDVIAAGGGTCMEMWTRLRSSDGKRVSVTLQLLENGEVSVWYRARS